MKTIPLTKGYSALVDDADYPELIKHRWHVLSFPGGKRYAARYAYQKDTRGKQILMHRQLTGVARGQVVDHRDHDGLNNQRDNLRVCSTAQNGMSRKGANSNSKTGILGVSPHHGGGYQVTVGGRSRGYFKGLEEAAAHRQQLACQEYGDFAPESEARP